MLTLTRLYGPRPGQPLPAPPVGSRHGQGAGSSRAAPRRSRERRSGSSYRTIRHLPRLALRRPAGERGQDAEGIESPDHRHPPGSPEHQRGLEHLVVEEVVVHRRTDGLLRAAPREGPAGGRPRAPAKASPSLRPLQKAFSSAPLIESRFEPMPGGYPTSCAVISITTDDGWIQAEPAAPPDGSARPSELVRSAPTTKESGPWWPG